MRKRCTIVTRIRTASIIAKRWPMQMRGPPPNGKYAKSRQPSCQIVAPSIRTELGGFLEVALIAMDDPGTHDDRGAGLDVIAADLAVLSGLTANGPRWREEAHRLHDDVLGEDKLLQVLDRCCSPAENRPRRSERVEAGRVVNQDLRT